MRSRRGSVAPAPTSQAGHLASSSPEITPTTVAGVRRSDSRAQQRSGFGESRRASRASAANVERAARAAFGSIMREAYETERPVYRGEHGSFPRWLERVGPNVRTGPTVRAEAFLIGSICGTPRARHRDALRRRGRARKLALSHWCGARSFKTEGEHSGMTLRDTRCAAQWRGARCVLSAGHTEAHRTTWEEDESDESAPTAALTADLVAALVASRHQLVVVSGLVGHPEQRASILRAIRLGDAALARAEREASAGERGR